MSWFKSVVLISSYQDQYVPFESSRILKMENNPENKLFLF